MTQDTAPQTRPSRTWLWVVLGMAGVLLVILMGIRLYFNSDRLKRILTPVLTQVLQRPVELDRVGITFWGRLGASVEGLKVAERAGFGPTPFVKADRTALSLELWPLLTGEAKLGAVLIENPVLSVVIDENGEANYADLTTAEEGAKKKKGRVSLPVDRILISGGALRYEDRQTGSVTRIEGIDYRLHVRIQPEGLALDGDLSVAKVETVPRQGKGTAFAGVSLSHRLFLETGKDALTIASLRVIAGPLEVEAAGQVTQLSDIPYIALEVKEQALDMARVAAYLAESGISAEGVEVRGEGRIAARIQGPWNADVDPPVYPAVSARMTLKDISVRDPALKAPVEGVQAELTVEDGVLRVESLRARAGRSDFSVAGQLAGVLPSQGVARPRPYLKLEVASKVLDLDELMPAAEPGPKADLYKNSPQWGLSSPAYAAAAPTPSGGGTAAAALGLADLDAAARIGELKYRGASYRNLTLQAASKDGMLKLDRLYLETQGGRVDARGEADARKPDGPFPARISLTVEGLPIEGISRAYLDSGQAVSGTLGLSLQVKATVDAAFKPVQRRVSGRLVEPALSGQVTLSKLFVKTPDLLVPLENGEVALSFQEDVVQISKLSARAGRSDFSVTGSVSGALSEALRPADAPPTRPNFRLNLTSNVLDLDEMVPVVAPPAKALLPERGTPWGLTTPAYGAAAAGAPDQTSAALLLARIADGEGALQAGELKSEGVTYRNLRTDLRVKDRILYMDNLRARLYGGDLEGQIEVDARPPAGNLPVKASISLAQIQANGLIQEYLKWGLPIFGEMGLSLTMTGTVDSTLEVVEKEINAEGNAGVAQGKIVNWQVLKQAAANVSQLGFLNTDEIPLRNLKLPFRVADGHLHIDEMKVVAADLACRLSGSVGLDGALDCTLDVDVPAARLNVGGVNLGSALGALFGGKEAVIPLRVVIGGTSERPQVSATLQPGGKTQVQEKKEETKEKLKEKGKGLLKGLF